MTIKSFINKNLFLGLCCIFYIQDRPAISFVDQERDRAIVMVPHKTGGTTQHFRAYHCENYNANINKQISTNQLRPTSRMDGCQEISTKFLPILVDEIKKHYGSRSMPRAWQGRSPDELLAFLSSEERSVLAKSDFEFLLDFMQDHYNRRDAIARRKVTTFRLRVQEGLTPQIGFDENRPHTTCTASLMKIRNKCHLFTNEHCIQSNPAILTIDIPELSSLSVEVQEKDVAPEWDIMTLKFPPAVEKEFCSHLENINQRALTNHALDPENAFYSLGYSGRSGSTRLDIFSSHVDQAVFKARDTSEGSIRRNVKLEFPGGRAQVYNYLPTYRGMSGGVLTDETGSPLCLIHRTVPQQDTPQCVDLSDLNKFIEGELPRADPENQLLNPELFSRTYDRFDVAKNFVGTQEDDQDLGDQRRRNQIAPGNSFISPGNTSIPPGNTSIPPGNTSIPPGNTSIPPGNTSIPPGNTSIPPGNTSIPPGNTSIPPSLLTLNLEPDCWSFLTRQSQPNADFGEFIEALEGIVDHNDSEARELLAVRCGPFSPWEQIDGQEDYVNKLSRYHGSTRSCIDVTKLPERDKVYRDKDGYVPLSHRTNLLERLKGSFFTSQDKAAGRYLVYESLPEKGALLTPKQRLSVHHRIQVNPDENKISIHLGGRPGPYKDGSIRTDFKVKYENEGKTIKLIPQNTTGNFPGNQSLSEMTCENKNFLKLICKGATSAFSMSLNDNGNNKMAIRFSSFDRQSRQFIHTHGDLHENL